jgi:hypothetical protein
MAGIIGQMAVTVRIAAMTASSRDGAGPHIAQLGQLRLNSGAAAFEFNQRDGHEEPPVKPSVLLR